MLTYAVPAVRFSTSALIGLPAIGPTNFVASKSPWAKTPLKRPPPGAAGGGPPIGYSQTMTGPAVFESPRWMWAMITLSMFAAMTLKCIDSPSALSSKIATPRACVSRGVGLSLIPARTAFHCVPAPSSARAMVTANAAVTRAIASTASPIVLVDNSFPSGDRIAQGDDILHAGHEHGVRLIDVRRKSGLHPATHCRQEDLVNPRAVRSLKAFRRREGEDFLFCGRDELSKGAVDLRPAFDDLESHGRRLPRPAGELRPRLEERLPHGIELPQLGALLLRDHLEDVVDGPGRVSSGSVQRDLDEAAGLESLQGAVRLHAIDAARAGHIPRRRRSGAGEVHEHKRFVPAQTDPLERLRGLRQFHRRPIGPTVY